MTWTVTNTTDASDGPGVFDITLVIGTAGADSGKPGPSGLSEFSIQFTGATNVTVESTNTGWSSVAPGNCVSSMANFWCVSGSNISLPDGTETFVFDVTAPNAPTESDIHALQGQGALAISEGVGVGSGSGPNSSARTRQLGSAWHGPYRPAVPSPSTFVVFSNAGLKALVNFTSAYFLLRGTRRLTAR